LATVTADNAVRVWNAQSGEPLTPAFRDRGTKVSTATSAAFSADGRRLFLQTEQAVLSWSLEPDPRPTRDLKAMAELISAHRIDNTEGPVPLTPVEWRQRRLDLEQGSPG
jgi:hypothetical protein